MKGNLKIKKIIPATDDKYRARRFWFSSFAVYALVESVIILVNYFVNLRLCAFCVQAPYIYFLLLVASLLFTGLLWYALYNFYSENAGILVMGNILLFAAHYFLWIGFFYLIPQSGKVWVAVRHTSVLSFTEIIYNSWYDIGKYVLKLSAFYLLKYYYDYRESEKQRIALAVLNKDLQLNLLNQQLSPHFYFNTLNNLYGLARSNSQKLPEALLQLSNIMQYVITDCNKPKVLLSQEISFLKSYISLEKLRYENNTVIDMEVSGDPNRQLILPLLLIQFVENAFKHGMKEKSEQNWMKVQLAIEKDALLFSVNNSYYETMAAKGIGIESVQQQLQLQYEGKYSLEMKQATDSFSVHLKLNLS